MVELEAYLFLVNMANKFGINNPEVSCSSVRVLTLFIDLLIFTNLTYATAMLILTTVTPSTQPFFYAQTYFGVAVTFRTRELNYGVNHCILPRTYC